MKHFTLFFALITGLGMVTTAWAGNKLFVGGLPFAASSTEVNSLVSGFGVVLSVKVNSIDADGDLSANAIVEMASEEAVDLAKTALDGFIYQGAPLRAKSRKVREIVVVGSTVEEAISEAGLRSDGELVQALSDDVYGILATAIRRTKANGRSTVRPHDL